jgi:hypothetical protein
VEQNNARHEIRFIVERDRMSGVGISVDTLAAAYELLKVTTPFRGLRLPASHDIIFQLTKDKALAGYCNLTDATMISISSHFHSQLQPLLVTMAHEMIHLHEFRKYGKAGHGETFQKLAARVCRAHGFDPKVFR